MRRLLQIRGSNGTGKTTMVRNLLGEGFTTKQFNTRPDYAVWFSIGVQVTVGQSKWIAIGDYNKLNAGLDNVRTTEDALVAIESAWNLYPNYSVVFEGALASTVYSTWAEFGQRFSPNYRCAFMATPCEVSLERIQVRRAESGKPPKDVKNTVRHFGENITIKGKYERDGVPSGWVLDLSHVEELLK